MEKGVKYIVPKARMGRDVAYSISRSAYDGLDDGIDKATLTLLSSH